MMKFILPLIFVFIFFSTLNSQDCTGGRYQFQIFDAVAEELNVPYGKILDTNGNVVKELFVDIYFPENDNDTDRPLLLLAHGGSFVGGDKSDFAEFCREFAKQGFVAASLQYRLLNIGEIDHNLGLEVVFKREVVDASHDMRAAIRYFRKTAAEENNPYGINPNIIIVGGASAGAILANHVTYLDRESKIPSDLLSYFNENGGIEGNSGNPGYDSRPQMTLSWCGAIMDTSWMENNAQPFLGVHNVGDNVVPNLSGQPSVNFLTVPVTLQGDSLMYIRALNQGINSRYKSYPGNDHCVFGEDMGQIVAEFVYDQLCHHNLGTANEKPAIYFTLFPNPAKELFTIEIPENQSFENLEILNFMGQSVYQKRINPTQNKLEFHTSDFQNGIYFVQLSNRNGVKKIKKLIINN